MHIWDTDPVHHPREVICASGLEYTMTYAQLQNSLHVMSYEYWVSVTWSPGKIATSKAGVKLMGSKPGT